MCRSYLVHILSWFSAQVLQREVPDDLAVVAAAHVHNQEAVVFVGIDLMQGEHGRRAVLHDALLSYQSHSLKCYSAAPCCTFLFKFFLLLLF